MKYDKLIIGLCNPGVEFDNTGHNAGKEYVKKYMLEEEKTKEAIIYKDIENKTIWAYSNNLYMNQSGLLVLILKRKYNFSELVVVHDEGELPKGEIKEVFGTSAKGHNGVKDIIRHLKTDQFKRIKIGIGGKNNILKNGIF